MENVLPASVEETCKVLALARAVLAPRKLPAVGNLDGEVGALVKAWRRRRRQVLRVSWILATPAPR